MVEKKPVLFLIISAYCLLGIDAQVNPLRERWYNLTRPYYEVCINETKVSRELAYTTYLKGIYEEDACLMCFHRCVSTKLKLYTGSDVQIKAWVFPMGANQYATVLCYEETYDILDRCQKIFYFTKCLDKKPNLRSTINVIFP
ncbi:hypothetical protein FQA39_LY09393 [Lamprigera yunnana]|nr:hypothetical protein FQA39_LY09393 [Lamprigera yunnana]